MPGDLKTNSPVGKDGRPGQRRSYSSSSSDGKIGGNARRISPRTGITCRIRSYPSQCS